MSTTSTAVSGGIASMGIRRILAGAFTAPLFLVTAACGGDDISVADPPISRHPSSSSPTEPPQRESPEHFIRRWAAAEKHMENTGATGEYLAMSHGCLACKKLAREIRSFYSSGGYVKWGGWRILSITVNSKQRDAVIYAVRNRSLPTTYQEAAAGPPKHLSGGVTTELLQLEPSGRSWNLASKAELAS